MSLRRLCCTVIAILALVTVAPSSASATDYYVEYYRDNLFLGLAYHRVGCLTDWSTIKDGQEYDGFTTYNYCVSGASSNSVPSGEWYDWNYVSGSTLSAAKASLDGFGSQTNWCYDTPGYQDYSNTCSYNIATECNSDCWIRNFSTRQGWEVETASGCWGSPPRSSGSGFTCPDQ